MNSYIKFKKSNCKNCYKCIRNCPVKSIRFSNDQAHIVEDECILCGHCFIVCPQNAKEIREDVVRVKEMIRSGKPVYVSMAPSFTAAFGDCTIAAMETALKKLGFAAVEETAIGATIVKRRYEEMMENQEQDVIISSCCHSVNLLIQKYFPKALPYLAHVMSPMQAHCQKIKNEHPDVYTVFIGPCISKKAEAEAYPGIVDAVLTFEELAEWMSSEAIVLEQQEDTVEKGRARLFPTTGGILNTMRSSEEMGYPYMVIDGADNCIRALKDISEGKLDKCFIEMSICAGSCVNGPVFAAQKNHIKNQLSILKYAGTQDFTLEQPEAKELSKSMPFMNAQAQKPGEAQIQEILRKMGKTSPADELNCGSCGYNTCREKAIAVYQGKAQITMCLPYLKEKAESFSDKIINNTPNGIMVLNESFEVQEINKAARRIMNIQYVHDILGAPVVRILDPEPYIQVLQTGKNVHDKRIYLAEYQKYVEETIIYDKNYHIIMSIMRDVTDEEEQRTKKESISQKTIEITDQMVEKQMRVVQEIASLLGETTAETKIALTKLKESLINE